MIITQNKKTIVLILIAFTFSFAIRLIWVQQFSGTEQFKFNGEFMINTNDGYFFAEGARDILSGKTENTNDLSPFTSAGSILTAWVAKIMPVSFETVIFYMPAFFSSLIVIPIILIGREFDKLEVGFIAALVGSIAWSYYNRTMVGYYDTDLLNIVFPTILLWSLIWAIDTKKNIYILIASIDILVYRWWYPQSIALEFAFVGLISLYGTYQYIKLKKQSDAEYQNSFVYYNPPITTNYGFVIELDFAMWTANSTPADGICIVLSDGTVQPDPGGWGGSLGYAQHETWGYIGMNGGFTAFAIDSYGNLLRGLCCTNSEVEKRQS